MTELLRLIALYRSRRDTANFDALRWGYAHPIAQLSRDEAQSVYQNLTATIKKMEVTS